MRKFVIAAAASALLVAVPAWAAKPSHPAHPAHPSHPAHPAKSSHPSHPAHGNGACTPRNEGYNARGTLDSASLTPAAKKGHFDGTMSVDVTRANHRAPQGTQPFVLTNARVRFGKGLSSTTVAAGDRVSLHGKLTVLPHGCSSAGFTPTVTVGRARIRAPKD